MLRLSKPVQILEWGEGTNTTNQVWTPMGEGKVINTPKPVNGVTLVRVEVPGNPTKQNTKDQTVKIAQAGEGMTPQSDMKGEVAFGRLKDIIREGGNSIVEIEIPFAIKVDKRR